MKIACLSALVSALALACAANADAARKTGRAPQCVRCCARGVRAPSCSVEPVAQPARPMALHPPRATLTAVSTWLRTGRPRSRPAPACGLAKLRSPIFRAVKEAPEGWAHSRTLARLRMGLRTSRSVSECGGPPPLSRARDACGRLRSPGREKVAAPETGALQAARMRTPPGFPIFGFLFRLWVGGSTRVC